MPAIDFQHILDSIKVAVAIADAKGSIAFANPAFVRLAGWSDREAAGRSLANVFGAGDRRRIEQNVARIAEGKAASAILEGHLQSAEDDRWVQLVLQPLHVRDKPEGVIAVAHDIGAQRDTEQALYVLTARLLALAEASPIPALIENTHGDVDMVNESFVRLLGLEGAPQSFMGLPAEDVLARSTAVDRATLDRQPIVVEGEVAGAIWSPRKPAAEDSPKGAAGIALIEKIGEELSVALEGISAISIRAQQMEFDPVLVEHFQRIRRSTEAALAAIGDLVDFSNISGSIVLRKAQFSLRSALATLVGRLLVEAEESDCRLRLRVEQDVSDALEGDVERVELVLRNLLASAFALLPGAEITLQITPEYVTESGLQLSFSVGYSDEGSLPPATVAAGAGMGIAVAKFMVAAMGGKLAVAAHPTIGDALYAFTIEFPVRTPPPAPARPIYLSLGGMTVLVVSANPEERLVLTNLLRGWRMIPLEADNAPMAMALLERLHGEGNPAPLVILSSRLSGQDGFLLAFRIKNHPKLGSTLVMMLAAEGRPGDAIACRENGISAYMRYPVNDRQLHEAITAVTGASSHADTEATATLVTRHSLREHRKGATVLLVDADADSQILAAYILGRHDCSVVVAHDLAEALAALDQDVYDLVLVDTSIEGLGGEDAARKLRARITRDAQATRLVAITPGDSGAPPAGFDATIAKPFDKDGLLALVDSVRRAVPA